MRSRRHSPSQKRRTDHRSRFSTLMRLEDRLTPSFSTYLPPSNFLINPDMNIGSPQRSAYDSAMAFVRDHANQFHATLADLNDPIITNQYADVDTGISHIYLRQKLNGLEVANANLAIGVAANGAVISVGGGFIAGLQDRLPSARISGGIMTPTDAVMHAARALELLDSESTIVIKAVDGPVQSFTMSARSVSLDDIPAKLHYVATADGNAALAWNLVIRTTDQDHWYDLSVDAKSGELVALSDWIDGADYNVVPSPNEAPSDGGFGVVTNPANSTASPFGWHDTNGVVGPEFTDTRGNNVDAHLDFDANNIADVSPPRPDGGSSLNFSNYTYNTSLQPSVLQNQNAAVVNLFYMNNLIHDIHYQYGFTEAAGNFQVNNYGKGGSGNDAVQADAQDGSGTNNANFGTPADGSAPRMQMYQWTSTNPLRDSDMDNGIIIHEYGHGVSNRLTGGAGNSNALNTTQSGGMGEGWSDFYALMLMQRPTDTQNAGYGIGTYVIGQSISGTGIRRFPYSYNMAINPLTFDAYGTSGSTSYGVTRSTEVHRTGELWCTALWDMNWLLINKYGYDPDLATGWSATAGPGQAGNKLALRLVMDAMKLQGANPSVINARDAIIAADIALNGGNDLFEIWSAFARRGLGVGASTVDGNATTITTDTSLPMLVSSVGPATGAVVTSHPASYTVNVTQAIDPTTLQASDLLVNGKAATGVSYTPGNTSATFTFAVDPITVEGLQTMQISGSAFNRASDNSPVAAFSSSFYFDASPLLVTSITPAGGSIVTVPLTTIDVNLNAAINPASVQNSDLSITQGTVTGFTLLNSDKTVRFTIDNLVNEGSMYVYVANGAFADAQGNPNAAFSGGSLLLDFATVAFPTPLVQRNLPGSLVYDGNFHANIGYAGDSDSITLDLDAGQLLDVVISPDSSLRPSLTITGPGTNLTNSATLIGGTAQLKLVPITTAGTYTFAVTGVASTKGDYGIRVQLNSGSENESAGGPSNDTTATAQNIDSLFIDLDNGVSRAAITGQSDLSSVAETEPNGTTANANSLAFASAAPTDFYQLMVSGELGVGNDSQDYFKIGQLQVGDVITVSESGKYAGRGTLDDAFLYLYRAGASTTILASDDDGGPKNPSTGGDSLIYGYTVTVTDTYYIRASRFGSTNAGTYQVGVLLQNAGAAPITGGNFVNEGTLANGQISTAEDASSSWRRVEYVSTANGTITSGDTDLFKYTFTAGDRVSLVVDSNSSLDPQAGLLDPLGVELATDDSSGPYAIPGGFAAIFGYIIPTTGDYYMRVTGAGSTTGSYTADVYASGTPAPPVLPPNKDHFSFTLNMGQSVTATLKNLSAGNLDIAVLDSGGAVLANGVGGFTNLDEIAANVVAPSTGTYYLRVSGPRDIDYQLTVVTCGTFDSESNDSFANAQSLGAGNAALGIIDGSDDWYSFTAVAGKTYSVTTSTPGGGSGEFTNNLDPLIELYNPSNSKVASDDNSATDGQNASLSYMALVSGNYRVRVTGAAATSGEYVLRVNEAAPPPQVANVVIGDGTGQRSRIESLTVNFDQVVTLPTNIADAFQLTRQGGGSVTLNATASNGPNTSVTITFAGGLADFGSLADGRYDLTINAAMITGTGGQLDGDGNGTGGDDFVLESDTAPSAPTNIFRLFGDSNGDGSVTAADFNDFRLAYGGGHSIFDFNDDNLTAASDFNEFRLRYGMGI